jgi:translation initiation factor eIF-2B subunit beta
MEVLSEVIDGIKAGRNYEKVLAEIIDMIKLFLKKNPSVTTREFQKLIKTIGGAIRRECPNAFPVLNFLTRIIKTSKKSNIDKNVDQSSGSHKLLRVLSQNAKSQQLESDTEPASNILEILNDLNDFESISEEIINIAKMHIHNNEIILVYGQSDLMRDFILSSIEDHQFSLIVVKNSMSDNLVFGNDLKNITYISENSVGSIINKVSKVFMDCHSVMADGAVINISGTFNVAIMAKEYSIPVIVLAPMHNFTPFYAFSQDSFNEFLRPQTFFSRAYSAKNIEVQIAKYDLIGSDYLTILITQYGEYSDSYVYRAFSEYYGEIEYGYEF